MSALFLSRTLAPADYTELSDELRAVDVYNLTDQARRWEFALALHALTRWRGAGRAPAGPLYNVSGGPTLSAIIHDTLHVRPMETTAAFVETCPSGAQLADAILALSVLEHVNDPERWLYTASCLLAPGGLLVLTMPFWSRCGPDRAHNYQTRQRIFCPKNYQRLRLAAIPLHLTTFGGVDTAYHGPQVFDYSVASLVLEKQR